VWDLIGLLTNLLANVFALSWFLFVTNRY